MNRLIQIALSRMEPLRPYFPHLLGLAGAILLGLTVGAFRASYDPKAVDTTDRWPFPKWAPYRAGSQRDAMVRAPIWPPDPSQSTAEAAPKEEGPPWRFVGTVEDGKNRLAIIELDQGKKIEHFASGDALPNGAQITKISNSELIYNEGGVQGTLRLFSADRAESTPATNRKN